MDPITKQLLDYGLTGLMLAIFIGLYLKVWRKDINDRELERDRLQSERMSQIIEQMRIKDKEHAEEKTMLRKEHSENWEIQHKRMREDRDIAREERAADRELFREMVSSINTGLGRLYEGQNRNFGLTLALGEQLGHSKKELVRRTEHISGQSVEPTFTRDETSH